MRPRTFLLLLSVFCLGWASQGRAADGTPRWTTSVRVSYWRPAVDNWREHFGHDGLWTFGVENGYKLTRRWEISLSLDYARDDGTGSTVSGRSSADEVTYRQVPVNLSLLYRFDFHEDQILVPYIGGGYSYVYYWQDFGGERIDGDRQGYHGRAGLQILLDALEPGQARNMREIWGVAHSYFTVEALYTSLDDFGDKEVDLGGTSVVLGLMFEY